MYAYKGAYVGAYTHIKAVCGCVCAYKGACEGRIYYFTHLILLNHRLVSRTKPRRPVTCEITRGMVEKGGGGGSEGGGGGGGIGDRSSRSFLFLFFVFRVKENSKHPRPIMSHRARGSHHSGTRKKKRKSFLTNIIHMWEGRGTTNNPSGEILCWCTVTSFFSLKVLEVPGLQPPPCLLFHASSFTEDISTQNPREELVEKNAVASNDSWASA